VNNADTNELYWVQFSTSWTPLLTLSLTVQLHSKLLVTVRDPSADCDWLTRHLLLHTSTHTLLAQQTFSATAYTCKQKEIEGNYLPPMPGLLTKK